MQGYPEIGKALRNRGVLPLATYTLEFDPEITKACTELISQILNASKRAGRNNTTRINTKRGVI